MHLWKSSQVHPHKICPRIFVNIHPVSDHSPVSPSRPVSEFCMTAGKWNPEVSLTVGDLLFNEAGF